MPLFEFAGVMPYACSTSICVLRMRSRFVDVVVDG